LHIDIIQFQQKLLLLIIFQFKILLFHAVIIFKCENNKELLEKLLKLEGVFHQQTNQMIKTQDRFDKELSGAHKRIEQLNEELSKARGKIVELEQTVKRLSDQTNKRPDNAQPMTQITEGDDNNSKYDAYVIH
jgi:TolA-binding protein